MCVLLIRKGQWFLLMGVFLHIKQDDFSGGTVLAWDSPENAASLASPPTKCQSYSQPLGNPDTLAHCQPPSEAVLPPAGNCRRASVQPRWAVSWKPNTVALFCSGPSPSGQKKGLGERFPLSRRQQGSQSSGMGLMTICGGVRGLRR